MVATSIVGAGQILKMFERFVNGQVKEESPNLDLRYARYTNRCSQTKNIKIYLYIDNTKVLLDI